MNGIDLMISYKDLYQFVVEIVRVSSKHPAPVVKEVIKDLISDFAKKFDQKEHLA